MKRKRTRLVLAAIALIAAGYAVWHFTRPVPRFIYGLEPIGRDEAVLLTRHNGDDETRFFVHLVRSDGTTLWDTELTPLKASEQSDFSGVVADADQIYILAENVDEETLSLIALSRSDGQERWRSPIPQSRSESRPGRPLIVDDDRIIVFHALKDPTDFYLSSSITAFARSNGALLWPKPEATRVTGDYRLNGVLASPGRLIIHDNNLRDTHTDTGRELDTNSGEIVRKLPIFWGFCAVPQGLIALGLDNVSLIPVDASGIGEPKVLMKYMKYDQFRPGWREVLCGVHGNLGIVKMSPMPLPPEAPSRVVIVAIDIDSTEIRWNRSFDSMATTAPIVAPDGVWPRFVPVSTERIQGNVRQPMIAVLDLETGELSSEMPVDQEFQTYIAGDHALLETHSGERVVGFDTTTGAQLPTPLSVGHRFHNFSHADILDGRMWLFRWGHSPHDELPWSVIDIPSWTIVHQNAWTPE